MAWTGHDRSCGCVRQEADGQASCCVYEQLAVRHLEDAPDNVNVTSHLPPLKGGVKQKLLSSPFLSLCVRACDHICTCVQVYKSQDVSTKENHIEGPVTQAEVVSVHPKVPRTCQEDQHCSSRKSARRCKERPMTEEVGRQHFRVVWPLTRRILDNRGQPRKLLIQIRASIFRLSDDVADERGDDTSTLSPKFTRTCW